MSEETRNHTDPIEKLHERNRELAEKLREHNKEVQEKRHARSRETAEKLRERNREVLERNREAAEKLASNAGSFVENSIGTFIEHRQEAPVLTGEAVPGTWYQIPLPDAVSGDGSEFHAYLQTGTIPNLVIFLSGGGVAWNDFTAARPVTGARVAAGEPNFYWNNLRPFTQIMNINIGITDTESTHNPFRDWNFLVIPYTTGDFHVGNRDVPYTDEEGNPQILHCRGSANVDAALAVCKTFFPAPEKLLVAGDSAGAFAVPAVARKIADRWYPEVPDITLFSDSAQLLCRDWKSIARDFWGADPSVWEPLETPNITYDWYHALLTSHPGRFRLLYASSTHDYLLSTFYNDMTNKVYKTNAGVRGAYYRQLKNMVHWLRELDPSFAFFINNWVNPLFTKAQMGTIHTAVRQPYFYVPTHGGVTMAGWLMDAVNGNSYDVGMDLLK